MTWAFPVLRKMEVVDEEDCDSVSELFLLMRLTLLIELLSFLVVVVMVVNYIQLSENVLMLR